MAINVATSVNWDMDNRHVQPSIQDNGVAVQAASILIAVGAPRLRNARSRPGILGTIAGIANPAYSNNFSSDLDMAYPVGMVESVSVGQNRQLQQFFEIGSKLRYFIPGRTVNSMTITRAYLDGPSLLKVLYAFYKSPEDDAENGYELPSNPNTSFQPEINEKNQPGYNSLWLNAASDLFDYPIGMLLYFRDNRREDKGAIYLENCNISGHNFGISASSIIFSESVTMQFDRVRPVNLKIG